MIILQKLLVVDLLAEREAFGGKGVEEIVKHFPNHEVLLWAPHTDEPREYGFGIRIQEATDADVVVITGSRRNVSMWEDWMDNVAKLIRECEVPIYGICFGHQIICKALGGEVVRASEGSTMMAEVTYSNGLPQCNYSRTKTTWLMQVKWKLLEVQNIVKSLSASTQLVQ